MNSEQASAIPSVSMLRNRHFIFLWSVNLTTTMAIELFTVTILVAIFQQTDSTLQAAGTMVFRSLPAFLLGPAAGVFTDRFPRKNVIIIMDMIRVVLIGIAFWFLQGNGEVPVTGIYLILTGLAAADVFHHPARLALIPSLVSRRQLVSANSFILVSCQVAMAISYTAGGWLILIAPLRHIALGVAVLFIISILSALFINVSERQDKEDSGKKESFRHALISGWNYLRRHPIARPLTVMETIEHLPHGIWTGALMLAFTLKALQGDASDWGYQVTGYFAGMILGSVGALAVSDWLGRYPGHIIAVNACATGLLTLAYASSQAVWIAVAWAFVFGPPNAVRDVAQDALLQGTVEKGQLGRVYATREMLRNAMLMFAGVFFAWLSDFVSIRTIYVTGGVIYLMTAFYALSNKALRESKMGDSQ
ncbi:MFS transporter [Desulfococcaceae bacterium HSG7]|nr:MFS transporter [Desulfococcaceae bacterium HSG7]